MVSKRVRDMAAASALSGTEKFYADDGSSDVYVTPNQVAAFTSGATNLIIDRVSDTTTTTGTGSITPTGTAPTGFRTFDAALDTFDRCVLGIVDQSTGDWEVSASEYTTTNLLLDGTNNVHHFNTSPSANYVNATGVNDAVLAPDGTTTGFTLIENTTLGTHAVGTFTSNTGINAQYLTYFDTSVYVKPGTRDWVQLEMSNNSFSSKVQVDFHLTGGGTVGTNHSLLDGYFLSAAISAEANGYYRCSVTGAIADGYKWFYISAEEASDDRTYAGVNGDTALSLWGLQISYPPVTTLQTTRALHLTRDTVLASSNSNALVNFGAGTKKIFKTAYSPIPPSGWYGGGGQRLVNVKQFGAVGDNSHDDTIAIQNAINYCFRPNTVGPTQPPINRATLYFPEGVYKTTGTLLFYLSTYGKVMGDGIGASIISNATASDTCVQVYGGKFIQWEGLQFLASNLGTAFDLNGGYGQTFISCCFSNRSGTPAIGIAIGTGFQGSEITFVGCTALQCTSGVTINNQNALNIWFLGCSVVSCSFGVNVVSGAVQIWGGSFAANTTWDIFSSTTTEPLMVSGARTESANFISYTGSVVADACLQTYNAGNVFLHGGGRFDIDGCTCGNIESTNSSGQIRNSNLAFGDAPWLDVSGNSGGSGVSNAWIEVINCLVPSANGNYALTHAFFDYDGVQYNCADGITALTDAATIVLDLGTLSGNKPTLKPTKPAMGSLGVGTIFTVTLTGNAHAIGAPTGLMPGKYYTWQITQPAAGGPFTVTWNAVFKFPAATAPTLSVAANAIDAVTFYCAATNVFRHVSTSLDVR